MKFLKEALRKIIQEELQSVLKEQTSFDPGMSMARQTPASLEDLAVGRVDVVGGIGFYTKKYYEFFISTYACWHSNFLEIKKYKALISYWTKYQKSVVHGV